MLIAYLRENYNNNVENISHFIGEPNTRLGSNPGGVFRNPLDQSKHYVKFYRDPEQAKAEVAASGIYNLLGAKTMDHRLVSYNGNIGVATKWNPNTQSIPEHEFQHKDPIELARIFHGAVLTKNWDAVGLDHDNIVKDHSDNLHSVDLGGTFKFRAQGAPKEYGPDIAEYDSLRDHNKNWQAASVFGHLTPEHLSSHKETLSNLNYDNVSKVFKNANMMDHDEHTKALLQRRDGLLSRIS